MKIGEVAKAAGVSVSTLRFYERQGLMLKPETRDSGYREYSQVDLTRLRLIVAAKRQRFPLRLIRVLLGAIEGKPEPCHEVAKIVESRLMQIGEEIAELSLLHRRLQSQLAAWREGRLPRSECLCAILETAALPSSKEKTMSKSTIEIFTAGCANCDEAVRIVNEAVSTCGCEVKVLTADGPEAKERGVNLAPCIWKDGERVFCGVPSLEEAIAKLRID